ncbi:hypothetical protein SALBM217S_10619 [Streptomyces griseoloalbus]
MEEYGIRTSELWAPAAPARASWVNASSRSTASSDCVARSGWEKVCTPISCPERIRSRTRSGWRAVCRPVTKKVPGTPWRSRTSRMRGVHTGSGPSSKVSTTVLAGAR